MIKLRRGTFQLERAGKRAGRLDRDRQPHRRSRRRPVRIQPAQDRGPQAGNHCRWQRPRPRLPGLQRGTATFQRLTITDGAAVNRGGGVNVFTDSKARFKRTTIAENTASEWRWRRLALLGREGNVHQERRCATTRSRPGNVGGGLGVFGRARARPDQGDRQRGRRRRRNLRLRRACAGPALESPSCAGHL